LIGRRKKGEFMSLSVLEVLQNAQINLVTNRGAGQLPFLIGKSQFENALAQLEKNPDASAEFIEAAAEESGSAG
jgi:hypothetical protein